MTVKPACCTLTSGLATVETTQRVCTGKLAPVRLAFCCCRLPSDRWRFLLCRYTALDRPVWESAERLVYYLLFPVLLFTSIVKSPLQPAQTASLAAAGVGLMLCGVALAFSLQLAPRVDARLHASGAQVAFRFNSYMALALSRTAGRRPGRGGDGAVMASLRAHRQRGGRVWSLARHGWPRLPARVGAQPAHHRHGGRACGQCGGGGLPRAGVTTLQRIGWRPCRSACCGGCGAQLGGLKQAPGLAATLLAIRPVVLRRSAWLVRGADAAGRTTAGRRLVCCLAPRLRARTCWRTHGGEAATWAGLVTLSTVLGMVSIPLALGVLEAMGL